MCIAHSITPNMSVDSDLTRLYAKIRSEEDYKIGAELDPSFYRVPESDKEFLHANISSDEDELRRRVLEVQEK